MQEWTTLRNLARLLRGLGDEDTAVFLEVAADNAPDAPAVTADERGPESSAGRRAAIEAQVTASSRRGVLDVARRAIERHRAALSPAEGSAPPVAPRR